mgnify:CR=1 FL=1
MYNAHSCHLFFAGDIQTDIVTLGGVDGLIAIVNEYVSDDSLNAESDDLVKSIYYAVQKLAENGMCSKHLSHICVEPTSFIQFYFWFIV